MTVFSWAHIVVATGGLLSAAALVDGIGVAAWLVLLATGIGMLGGRSWACVLALYYWPIRALVAGTLLYLGHGTIGALAENIIASVIVIGFLPTPTTTLYFDPPPWRAPARSLPKPVQHGRIRTFLWVLLAVFLLFSLGGEFILAPLVPIFGSTIGTAILLSGAWVLISLLLGLTLLVLTLKNWRRLGIVQRVVLVSLPVLVVLFFAFGLVMDRFLGPPPPLFGG